MAPPSPTIVSRHVGPGRQRVFDRLVEPPEQRTGREANVIWRFFAHDESRIARASEDNSRFARTMVSARHDAAARYPEHREPAAAIGDLRLVGDWFDADKLDLLRVTDLALS